MKGPSGLLPACLPALALQDMRCQDRKTSQSYETTKVEPYKSDCAPAVCPPGEACKHAATGAASTLCPLSPSTASALLYAVRHGFFLARFNRAAPHLGALHAARFPGCCMRPRVHPA